MAALKIDMSMAWDHIEWDFLRSMMVKLGFDAIWIEVIMLCVTTITYNAIREGTTVVPIVLTRGLRQGDPLSPYFFILCAVGLSSLLRKNKRAGFIHSAKVARGTLVVSHLFFADYCFLFFNANQREACLIKHMLVKYGVASGQVVNFNKSSILFSANVSEANA